MEANVRCDAKAKGRQAQCLLSAEPGMTKCRFHGGKSRRGPAAPSFKSGRYSKFLPSRLAAKYNEAQHDPELLSLHDEVALLDARLVDLLKRVDTGESGAMWGTLRKEWEEFLLVRASGDIAKMHSAIGRLDALMDRAITDHLAWTEISEKLEQRRRLVMSESQRLVALHQVLTAEQALALTGVLVEIITRHIADKSVLAQIIADVQGLIDHEPREPRPILKVLS